MISPTAHTLIKQMFCYRETPQFFKSHAPLKKMISERFGEMEIGDIKQIVNVLKSNGNYVLLGVIAASLFGFKDSSGKSFIPTLLITGHLTASDLLDLIAALPSAELFEDRQSHALINDVRKSIKELECKDARELLRLIEINNYKNRGIVLYILDTIKQVANSPRPRNYVYVQPSSISTPGIDIAEFNPIETVAPEISIQSTPQDDEMLHRSYDLMCKVLKKCGAKEALGYESFKNWLVQNYSDLCPLP